MHMGAKLFSHILHGSKIVILYTVGYILFIVHQKRMYIIHDHKKLKIFVLPKKIKEKRLYDGRFQDASIVRL